MSGLIKSELVQLSYHSPTLQYTMAGSKKTARTPPQKDDHSSITPPPPPTKKLKADVATAEALLKTDTMPEFCFDLNESTRTKPLSPKKKKKSWSNTLVGHDTKDGKLVVVWGIRGDKPHEAPFIYPMIQAMMSDPQFYKNNWQVLSKANRKGESGKDMTKSESSTYPWECLILFKANKDDTAQSVTENLAKQWNEFVENSILFDNKIPFVVDEVSDFVGSLPLSAYVRDATVLSILKKSFKGWTKKDLTNNDAIMANFFASKEEGKKVMNKVTDVEWNML